MMKEDAFLKKHPFRRGISVKANIVSKRDKDLTEERKQFSKKFITVMHN